MYIFQTFFFCTCFTSSSPVIASIRPSTHAPRAKGKSIVGRETGATTTGTALKRPLSFGSGSDTASNSSGKRRHGSTMVFDTMQCYIEQKSEQMHLKNSRQMEKLALESRRVEAEIEKERLAVEKEKIRLQQLQLQYELAKLNHN